MLSGMEASLWTLSVLLIASRGLADVEVGDPVENIQALRGQVIQVLDGWVDVYLRDQNHTAGDVRHGQFHKSDNMRMQECTQLIAWAYINKDSRHYGSSDVLDCAVWSIDYMVRAQGSNGGFNEYHGWCGAPERTRGKSSVTGFTLYGIGRAIAMLSPLPEMRQKFTELIDTDGLNGVDTLRIEAWRIMLKAAMENQYSGTGRGHAPNQDACALAAVFAMNEAWKILSPNQPPLKTQEEVAALINEILYGNPPAAANRPHGKWFTKAGMLLEGGSGFAGYDANYAQVALGFLALCARREPQMREFLFRFWEVLQYFCVPDSDAPLNVYMENGISRRVKSGAVRSPSLPDIALARSYHPAGERLYALALPGFATDVAENMRVKSPHHFQALSYRYCEWLDDFGSPEDTDYRLPTERPSAWEFRDAEAKILIQKAEDECPVYYTEYWEEPEMARRHIWGQEPEDIPSEGLFP